MTGTQGVSESFWQWIDDLGEDGGRQPPEELAEMAWNAALDAAIRRFEEGYVITTGRVQQVIQELKTDEG